MRIQPGESGLDLGIPDEMEIKVLEEETALLNKLLAACLLPGMVGSVYYQEEPHFDSPDVEELRSEDPTAWEAIAWTTVDATAWLEGLSFTDADELLTQIKDELLTHCVARGDDPTMVELAIDRLLEFQQDYNIGSLAQMIAIVQHSPLEQGEIAAKVERREPWSEKDSSALADDLLKKCNWSEASPDDIVPLLTASAAFISSVDTPIMMSMEQAVDMEQFLMEVAILTRLHNFDREYIVGECWSNLLADLQRMRSTLDG